jgi:hypothetical protein
MDAKVSAITIQVNKTWIWNIAPEWEFFIFKESHKNSKIDDNSPNYGKCDLVKL